MLTLITGYPGWLGTRLALALRDGLPDIPALREPLPDLQIRCLVKPGLESEARRLPGLEIASGSITDSDALHRFCRGAESATLFHCAGIVHPRRGLAELFRINVEGTRRLLHAALSAGVRRVVVVSSNSPFGNNRSPEELFDEHSPYHPYMAYGRSKMLMEQVVREIQDTGRMETVTVRPPWFYGPNQPPRQTLFFKMIRNGTFPILGGGRNRRSMGYMDNVCQGLLLCSRVPRANGQAYWIADRRPYTMLEIVGTVARLLETEFGIPVAKRQWRMPNMVGTAATWADGLLQFLRIYNQKIHVLSEMNKTIACSIAKAQAELGYAPAIELEEGMRRSLRWVLQNGGF